MPLRRSQTPLITFFLGVGKQASWPGKGKLDEEEQRFKLPERYVGPCSGKASF